MKRAPLMKALGHVHNGPKPTVPEGYGTFMCESDVFNGPHCATQCDRCKPKRKRGTDEGGWPWRPS